MAMTKSSDFFRSISMSHKVKQSKIQVDCTALKSKRQKKKVFFFFAVASCNISLSANKQGQRFRLDEQFVNRSNTCRNVQRQLILKRSLRYNLLNLHESLVVTTAQSWSDFTHQSRC